MSKKDCYSQKLSANKLKQCNNIASPRIKKYLEAEIFEEETRETEFSAKNF